MCGGDGHEVEVRSEVRGEEAKESGLKDKCLMFARMLHK